MIDGDNFIDKLTIKMIYGSQYIVNNDYNNFNEYLHLYKIDKYLIK